MKVKIESYKPGYREMESHQRKTINFYVKLLCKESQLPGDKYVPLSCGDFEKLGNFDVNLSDSNGAWYDCKVEITEQYLWMYALRGKAYPRNPHVIDTETNRKETNPRKSNMAEPTDSHFALIRFTNSCTEEALYTHPEWGKTFIQLLGQIAPNLSGKLHTKKCWIDPQEFLATLKSVDEIRLVEDEKSRHLLKKDGGFPDAFPLLQDFFGIDAPTAFRLSITVKLPSLTEKIKGCLTKVMYGKKSRVYSSLCVKGRNEDGAEATLNNETFSKKITFDADMEDNGFYSEDEVKKIKERLLERIYDA